MKEDVKKICKRCEEEYEVDEFEYDGCQDYCSYCGNYQPHSE